MLEHLDARSLEGAAQGRADVVWADAYDRDFRGLVKIGHDTPKDFVPVERSLEDVVESLAQ